MKPARAMLHIRTLILLAVVVTMSLLALKRLREHRLNERYVLLYLVTSIPVLVLALWPDGIVWLHQTLAIEKATLLVICASIYFLLITFSLACKVSTQERQIHTLAQELAILKARHAKDALAAKEREVGPGEDEDQDAASRAGETRA